MTGSVLEKNKSYLPKAKGVITFRTALPADIPRLRELYRQLIPDAETRPESMAAALANMTAGSGGRVIVGVLNDSVVATCQIIIYENLVRAPKRKAVIDSVVVCESHRGAGVCTAMLKWVAGILSDEGCSHVGVATRFSRTAAHHLYEKLNYEKFGYYFLLRP